MVTFNRTVTRPDRGSWRCARRWYGIQSYWLLIWRASPHWERRGLPLSGLVLSAMSALSPPYLPPGLLTSKPPPPFLSVSSPPPAPPPVPFPPRDGVVAVAPGGVVAVVEGVYLGMFT